MTQEEIKHWIERWQRLPQGPIRDMVIKIWSKSIQR
jgi:hypothetical protein